MKLRHCLWRGFVVLSLISPLFFTAFVFGQPSKNVQQLITGKITDENGKPLEGVTVAIKGTKTTVLTNAAGVFNISASRGNTLVASYVGLATQEIAVNGKAADILLKPALGHWIM